MPNSDAINQVIINRGLDPNAWTLSQDGSSLVPIQAAQPQQKTAQQLTAEETAQPVQNQVNVAPSVSSPTGTLIRSALDAAPSSAGAGLGAAGALALAGSLGLDMTGVGALAGIPIGIGGAYLAGKGVSKVQQAVESPEYQKSLEEAQADNPKSAIAGQLATLPLGGFNPNPANLVRAGGALGKLVTGLGNSPEELATLVNVGSGAVIGGVQPLIEGDTSPEDIAKNALIGGAFNSPNKIGKVLGFHPVQNRDLLDPAKVQEMLKPENPPQQQTVNTGDQTANVTPTANTGYTLPDVGTTIAGMPLGSKSTLTKRILYLENDNTIPQQQQAMEAEGGPPLQDPEAILAKQKAAKLSTSSGPFNLPEETPTQGMTPEQDLMQRITGANSVRALLPEQAGPNGDKNQANGNAPLTEAGKLLQQQAKDMNLDVGSITPRFFDKWAIEISALHGIKDTAAQGLTDVAGNPVKGTAHVGTNRTTINSDSADVGTLAHENFHHIFGAMSDDARTQLTDALKPELDTYNQERAAAGKQPMDAEEYAATQIGYKTMSRLLKGTDESPLKQWWNDTKAQWKVRYGKQPTIDDLYRANTVKLINGISNVKDIIPGHVTTITKNQPDESKYPAPEFIGQQPAFKHLPAQNLYNLKAPIFNTDGTIKHGINSTVSERTLKENGIEIPQPKQQSLLDDKTVNAAGWFAKMREAVNKNQPDSEGLQTKEEKNAYNRQRRQDLQQQTLAIRGDQPARSAGEAPNTYPEKRAQLISPLTEDVKDKDGNVTQEGELTQIHKLVNSKISKITGLASNRKTGYSTPIPDKSLRKDIYADVVSDIQSKGIDKDGLMATASRRAHEYLQQRIDEARRNPKTQEITAKEEKKTAQDIEEGKEAETTGEEAKGVPVDTEYVPTEASAKPKTEMMADDLLWHLEDRGALETDLGKKAAEYLEGQKGKMVNVNEVMKMIGAKNQEEGEGLTKSHGITPEQKYNAFGVMAQLDKVRRATGAKGRPVADALQQVPVLRDQIYGKGTNEPLGLAEKMSEADVNKVHKLMINEDLTQSSNRALLTSDKQRALYDSIRASLKQKQEDQIAAGQKVKDFDAKGKPFERDAKVNPYYYPSIMRPNVIDSILEHKGLYKQYENQIVQHWIDSGMTKENAEKRFDSMKAAADSGQKNETRFGANRLSEGMGLPESVRDTSLPKTISKYFNKVATDRAWHDVVEKNPEVAKLLDPSNRDGVAHDFEGITSSIKGEPFDKDAGVIRGWSRIFTSALLGPMTNLHIGWSTLFNPFQYVKGSELASVYGKALANYSEAGDRVLQNGLKRRDLSTINDIFDKNNTFIQKAQAVSSLIGKANGREFTAKVSSTMAQALSEQIVPLRMADARLGDEGAQKLILGLDPTWTKNKQYTPDEMNKLASTMAGFIHGTHDFRTLPEFMNKESIIKPFLSLMSWSVSQTNQWMKHVWEPATRGNLQPLLMSTLGAATGGYIIQQLRQEISDKKSAIPSLSEIANSSKGLEGNIPLLAYNFMQMASFTGMMGLGSSFAKMGFDAAYKNIPQSATFPMDEAISNVATTVSEGVSAWLQNRTADNFFQIMPRMLTDMARENVQSARIALSWAAKEGLTGENEQYKKNLNSDERDLRSYKMAEGLPYDQQTESLNNPYLNIPAKNFKRTQDLSEAAHEVPWLISQAVQQSDGNPDVLKSRVEALKQNSYQTMPSPENMPVQFGKYYSYLVRTYGEDIANQRMTDYMKHNAINSAKASLLPAF